MRIAMLAPVSWRTPPRHYGPWEKITSLLTEELVARGVDVTLFATRDSITAGRLAGPIARGYSEDVAMDARSAELMHAAHLFEQAGEFDLIHNQADYVPLGFSGMVDTPMVTTLHGLSSERLLPIYRRYQDRVNYVAISDSDRHPGLHYAATIHHGVALDEFPFAPHGGEGLIFFGRIHPDKGTREAIVVAKASGRRLDIAGIVHDRDYFEREVRDEIDGAAIRFAGPVGGADRARALGGARALLHLINFDEPFGLSVVEAMACGTPVIACRRGSMPELIEDGVTGFLVGSTEEAVEAVGRIGEIDRRACRAAVTARFTVARMADRYLDLYRSLIAGRARDMAA
jgi:glycosyltransferase involved in cell wall biosynthesis